MAAVEARVSEVRHALAEALGVVAAPVRDARTVGVDEAAVLLHTTKRGIYERRRRGQMPRPITARPLVWRIEDVLAMEA